MPSELLEVSHSLSLPNTCRSVVTLAHLRLFEKAAAAASIIAQADIQSEYAGYLVI
jgi:hypothetical protein